MSTLASLFDRAFEPLTAAVSAKRIPGGVLGIIDRNGDRITRAIGSSQLVPKQRPMQVETWFDLASLTKIIFTTPRILALAVRHRQLRSRRAADLGAARPAPI